MTMINQLVNLGAVVVSMAVVDRLGRRPLLMIGSSIQLSALFSMAALGVVPQTNGTKTGIVALLTVFGFGFSIGWAPVSHILSAELPSTRLRDMTYRTASAVNIMVQFATAFSIPYLLDSLDSKVGFVFGTAAVLALLFSFFCVPECNHRTLEEIDQMFLDGTPIRKFHKVETVIIRDAEGHGHVAGDVVDPDAKPSAVQKEYDV